MQGRYELFEVGGGDKVQIENTANELRTLGVSVEISTNPNTDPSKFDLVHIFQLDWVAENYLYARKAKRKGVPIVLSPIHHSLEEVKRFDDEYAFGFRRLSKSLFSDQFARDTFKNVYRSIFNPKKIPPTALSILLGLKRMHKKVIEWSDLVLVQTEIEAADLKDVYEVDFDWEKVPNGVAPHFLKVNNFQKKLDFEDYLLCVGRIEPRKNQLSLIEATRRFREEENVPVNLVFVGDKSFRKHFEYVRKFNKLVAQYDWVHFVGRVPYIQMPSMYHFAKVGLSASWFESTGLTSLEALFCGTNAVASGDQAKEYLGDLASYAEPNDVVSIEEAIKKEYLAKRPQIPVEMKSEYTWLNAAKKTLAGYNSVLAQKAQ